MVIPDNHRPSLPPAVAGSDYLFRSRAGTDRNNDRKSKDLITSRSNVDFALAQTRDGSRAGRAEIRIRLTNHMGGRRPARIAVYLGVADGLSAARFFTSFSSCSNNAIRCCENCFWLRA